MYHSVLVPTDGSIHAQRAAEHATYLAEHFDAMLHVVHVVDVNAKSGPFSAGGVGEEFLERLKAEGRQTIAEFLETVGETETAKTEVVTGRPAGAILEYTGERDIDLICMGTHGRTGVERYVMGSVAERVVSLASVPVLTVTASETDHPIDGYDDVLIPTDGTAAAEAAIEHGLAVADTAGGTIHAVSVVQTPALSSSSLSLPADVRSALESASEKATETVADRARDVGLDAVTEIRDGAPADTVLTYADEQDIDLIALGTTGSTGLSRHLLGSTADRVIRHAEVPVLAVNARERTGDE